MEPRKGGGWEDGVDVPFKEPPRVPSTKTSKLESRVIVGRRADTLEHDR